MKKVQKKKIEGKWITIQKIKILCGKSDHKQKKYFFENKLKESIGKPKELWKNLKAIGLPKKVTSKSANICLKNNGTLSFDLQKNAEIFKEFYSNLAKNIFLINYPMLPKNLTHYPSLTTTQIIRSKGIALNFQMCRKKLFWLL